MRIEVLNKTLLFYEIKDVFDIIPEFTIQHLKNRLDILFAHQMDLQKASEDLAHNSLNNGFITSVAAVAKTVDEAEWLLNNINIRPTDLVDLHSP